MFPDREGGIAVDNDVRPVRIGEVGPLIRKDLAMGDDHAFVWINEQYGRMMYAGFGHEPGIFADRNVRSREPFSRS